MRVSIKRDWLVIAEPNDPHTVHVVPRNDLVEHDDIGIDCICGPRTEHLTANDGCDAWLVTHHSLDGRELRES